jgi:hypothetical protein
VRPFRLLLLLLLAAPACTSSASPRAPASTSQRIVYLVKDSTGSSPQTTTVVTDIAPPYRARTVTHSGSSVDAASAGGFAWDEGGVYTISPDGSSAQTEYVGPGFPGPFSRLDVALPVARRQHLVTRLGDGRVGGRACARWLSRLPLDGAPFAPAAGGDRTESCVDPAGRLLSDTWQVAGKVVRTRTGTLVETGPSLDGTALFFGRMPTPLPTRGSAYVVRSSTAKEIAGLLQVPEPTGPDGLAVGRTAVVLDVDAARQGFAREAAVLTWSSPGQLAVLRVERDLQAGGGRTVRGALVALGALGTGRLEAVLAGLRVTVEGPRGLRLVATADLPESALLAWVGSLQLGG